VCLLPNPYLLIICVSYSNFIWCYITHVVRITSLNSQGININWHCIFFDWYNIVLNCSGIWKFKWTYFIMLLAVCVVKVLQKYFWKHYLISVVHLWNSWYSKGATVHFFRLQDSSLQVWNSVTATVVAATAVVCWMFTLLRIRHETAGKGIALPKAPGNLQDPFVDLWFQKERPYPDWLIKSRVSAIKDEDTVYPF